MQARGSRGFCYTTELRNSLVGWTRPRAFLHSVAYWTTAILSSWRKRVHWNDFHNPFWLALETSFRVFEWVLVNNRRYERDNAPIWYFEGHHWVTGELNDLHILSHRREWAKSLWYCTKPDEIVQLQSLGRTQETTCGILPNCGNWKDAESTLTNLSSKHQVSALMKKRQQTL